MPPPTFSIRRIRPEEGPQVREVRLRALQTDPSVFESVYEREANRGPEVWDTWAATGSTGDDQALFVAERGEAFAGLAGAFREEGEPRALHLFAMWVEPDSRRRGIGRRLVEAVVSWAVTADADTLHLWVVAEATAARRFYEQMGFLAREIVEPVASRPEQTKRLMELALERGGPRGVPPGYVELAPVSAAEFDAYATWAVASHTADRMEADRLDLTAARLEAERHIAGLLPSREATPGHHVCTIRAGLADEVVGWAWFASGERGGEPVCVLHDLIVFEPFRDNGIGAAAVDEVEEWARTKEHTAVVLEVLEHNARARQFLERLGYEATGGAPGRATMAKLLTR